MSVAASSLGAIGSSTAESAPALAAERVQQLQALIAQVESGTGAAGERITASSERPAAAAGSSFAASLAAAQAGSPDVPSAETATSTAPYGNVAGATLDTATAGAEAPNGGAYTPLIEQAAARNGLNPALLYGLIQQESGFDPSARSGAGAEGLTQLMPTTAASLGVAEPLNPSEAIEGGARYLSGLLQRFAGNTADALAAYNAGPGAVQQYGGVPPYPETRQYVTKVLGYAAAFNQGGTGEVHA